jgi:hypothetical protein
VHQFNEDSLKDISMGNIQAYRQSLLNPASNQEINESMQNF